MWENPPCSTQALNRVNRKFEFFKAFYFSANLTFSPLHRWPESFSFCSWERKGKQGHLISRVYNGLRYAHSFLKSGGVDPTHSATHFTTPFDSVPPDSMKIDPPPTLYFNYFLKNKIPFNYIDKSMGGVIKYYFLGGWGRSALWTPEST